MEQKIDAGGLLRSWRHTRRLSQLDLANRAQVSTKHLSFVETGRAGASRALLIHLASVLDMPLRERNTLLLASGYAPQYPDAPLTDASMAPLRSALRGLLRGYEPNPTVVVDRHWNLIDANATAGLLVDGVDPELLAPPINVLRLTFHPGGMPRITTRSPSCAVSFLERLRQQGRTNADAELLKLLDEMEDYIPASEPTNSIGDPTIGSFELKTRLGTLRLFTVIATLGAPMHVTSADLAIESFVPADPESTALLRELAEDMAISLPH